MFMSGEPRMLFHSPVPYKREILSFSLQYWCWNMNCTKKGKTDWLYDKCKCLEINKNGWPASVGDASWKVENKPDNRSDFNKWRDASILCLVPALQVYASLNEMIASSEHNQDFSLCYFSFLEKGKLCQNSHFFLIFTCWEIEVYYSVFDLYFIFTIATHASER